MTTSEFEVHWSMKTHRTCHGAIDTKKLGKLDLPTMSSLNKYLKDEFNDKMDLIKGCFYFIVDSGCACSCSPFKEDFTDLQPLKRPIILKGVTGDITCHYGGTIRVETINSKGNISVLETPGYYNPEQSVRLFSPQSHFWLTPKHEGLLCLSWAKTFLELPGAGRIPLTIDKTSMMPLMTCFQNADAVVEYLSNPCVTDDINPNLTKPSKMLHCFHYKLGHLGFQHLRWILRHMPLFGAKGWIGHFSDTDSPLCTACIQGGMQRRPIKGNTHTQRQKGSLKREQLIPGQRMFSDQLVCSTPGRHCNGRGQPLSTLPHRGGTVFCDAASGYISLHHQVSFTAHETQQSMLSFERESAAVGVEVKGYNTDNGVYTAKDILARLDHDDKTLRLSGVGAHHHNGAAENAIKNISRKARIFMFHAAIRWPEAYDKTLWPFATSHAVHLHNHIPRRSDKLAPIELWP